MFKKRRHDPGTGGGGAGTPPPGSAREWTFMVYLAGDNNLEDYGRLDLLEMKQVGSTPQVAIVAQFDRMQEGTARRYYLRKGENLEEDEIGPSLGQTNTGDPHELVRFMTWAMREYPAKRYALILWNHGTGWKEDDVYQIAKRSGIYSPRRELDLAPLVAGFVRRAKRPVLFSATINAILARGIAYDDTSCDFLDNAEMKQAIRSSLQAVGVEKLALLGFDACLMNMLEVAYQVKDLAWFVAGSEETEPIAGWPYDTILTELAKRPTMEGEGLSAVIVDEYMRSYGPQDEITQSALDLSQAREVVLALNDMCKYVLENQDGCELAVGRSSRRAQSYSDPDYKDLYDFCRLLNERAGSEELKRRTRAVMELLAPSGVGRFVYAEAHRGLRMSRSHGVSIYFPGHAISPFYRRLDFTSESLWDDMLRRLFGT